MFPVFYLLSELATTSLQRINLIEFLKAGCGLLLLYCFSFLISFLPSELTRLKFRSDPRSYQIVLIKIFSSSTSGLLSVVMSTLILTHPNFPSNQRCVFTQYWQKFSKEISQRQPSNPNQEESLGPNHRVVNVIENCTHTT